MILFTFPVFAKIGQELQRQLLEVERGQFSIHRFDNQELYVAVSTSVAGQLCTIISSIAPPDEQLLATLVLAHTLKKEGAIDVVVLLPYLAYSRHDKDEPGKSLTLQWIGQLFHASHVDRVITIDTHSDQTHKLFPLPLASLSASSIFAAVIKKQNMTDATVVAPDRGALQLAHTVRQSAHMESPEAYFEKRRTIRGVTHSRLHGEVSAHVILIDDMLDTGGTLISACKKLKQKGVQKITVMVTHGLFTGDRWQKLWQLGVDRIYCTDTVPVSPEVQKDKRVTVLPAVIPLFKEYIEMHNALRQPR